MLGGIAILALGIAAEFLPQSSWFFGYSRSLYVIAGAWWLAALIHWGFESLRNRRRQKGQASTAPGGPEFRRVAAEAEKKPPADGEDTPERSGSGATPFPDQEFADWLTQKYEYGVHKLLNGPIDSDPEFAAIRTDDDAWVREVSLELVRHGASRQEWVDFAFLQEVPTQPQFHGEPSRDHLRRMINVRLNRLKKAIDRYSERPTFYRTK